MWSQAYDRELDDIFAVQDDIAQSVVQELRSALLGEQADAAASARVREQVRAATRGRTLNAQAHELYLLGRFLVDRMNPDDTTTAIGYYRQALQPRPALCARVGRAWRARTPTRRTIPGRRWHRRSNWPAPRRCMRSSWSPSWRRDTRNSLGYRCATNGTGTAPLPLARARWNWAP